jgi:hypothetical protein
MSEQPQPQPQPQPERKRCVGFTRSRAHHEMWTPCVRAALPSDRFCITHRDGLNGALMGLANCEQLKGLSYETRTQPRPQTERHKKPGRYETVSGERALVEGVPHLEISLGEIRAASKFGPGAEEHECSACSDHRGERRSSV